MGGSLLPLKIVDDVDNVEKEQEAGAVHSLAVAGSADALTLPASTQHVDGTMSFHQIGEKGWAALVHVLRQAIVESPDGCVWQLVWKLVSKLLKNCSCHASAHIILVHVRVAPNLVACSRGRV